MAQITSSKFGASNRLRVDAPALQFHTANRLRGRDGPCVRLEFSGGEGEARRNWNVDLTPDEALQLIGCIAGVGMIITIARDAKEVPPA